jgi:hypothetical protein
VDSDWSVAVLMSERTYAQSLQDDEDHHLRMCGLLLDARDQDELEDREYEYHDFIFGPPTAGSANTLPAGPNGAEPSYVRGSAPSTFARPALPPMERAKRGQVCWEENATALAGMPGPTPLSSPLTDQPAQRINQRR